MAEKPILFSSPMVRAILEGRKTQTRRICPVLLPTDKNYIYTFEDEADWRRQRALHCPYGAPGDSLWVRETWQYSDWTEDGEPFIRYKADGIERLCEGAGDGETLVETWAKLSDPANYAIDNKAADRKWRPSIFMPRWASRITLEIKAVRVERLQEISEADAKAEGVLYSSADDDQDGAPDAVQSRSFRQTFKSLWNDINGKRASWESNPWVWMIEFERKQEGK